ncbi:MAG: hypothetical protein ACOX6T_13390 [Myxococcales bacterium]
MVEALRCLHALAGWTRRIGPGRATWSAAESRRAWYAHCCYRVSSDKRRVTEPSKATGPWSRWRRWSASLRPIRLAQVKADGALKDFALVTRTRLSVALVTGAQFVRVLALAGTRLPRG